MYEKLHSWKWQDLLLAIGFGLVTVGIGFNLRTKLEGGTQGELIKAKATPSVTVTEIALVTVDVEGEVMYPGVYKLKRTDKVQEALVAAGGLSSKADRDWVAKNLNRAESLSEGLKIYIPKAGEVLGTETAVLASKNQLININTATTEELEELPGIGPAMAGRIIEYRKTNQGYKDINELKMVSGIGDKLYEKIKNLVEI
jgi:competence protein ComEA